MDENNAISHLHTHYDSLRSHSLKQLMQENNRFTTFSCEVAGIFIDYSKNWITTETLTLLSQFAYEKKLDAAIATLFAGEKINTSEQRTALHWALRLPKNTSLTNESINTTEIQSTLKKMATIADLLQQKQLFGYSGKPIDTILHVGIGGSGLGPLLYYDAMCEQPKQATCHFLTEFDFPHIHAALTQCNPETTLVIIVSKSFKTEETLMMFETIRGWFNANDALQKQCYAVTNAFEQALSQGFLANHIFPLWDSIGGRYSVWSAVNFANVLVYGIDYFQRFLDGAHTMDCHFQSTPLEHNIPVRLALISFWYNNFFHAHSKAIVPYGTKLSVLVPYLQQLHMESLGKNITTTGEKILSATGQVIWGSLGPSSQHSFHQLLMQGSQMVPVDFILPFYQDTLNDYDIKRALYCLSQSQTLLQGFTGDAHQHISGDRPSTTMIIRHFSPETLGALLALYEHQVFVKSVLWDINPFDQWGVERGKRVAEELFSHLANRKESTLPLDSSTAGLLEQIFARAPSLKIT